MTIIPKRADYPRGELFCHPKIAIRVHPPKLRGNYVQVRDAKYTRWANCADVLSDAQGRAFRPKTSSVATKPNQGKAGGPAKIDSTGVEVSKRVHALTADEIRRLVQMISSSVPCRRKEKEREKCQNMVLENVSNTVHPGSLSSVMEAVKSRNKGR